LNALDFQILENEWNVLPAERTERGFQLISMLEYFNPKLIVVLLANFGITSFSLKGGSLLTSDCYV